MAALPRDRVRAALALLMAGAEQVRFDNGNRATLVQATSVDDAGTLVDALELVGETGRPVLLVCGGADELQGKAEDLAAGLLGPAVASAAETTSASVVDGGTASGVMALTGAARAERPSALSVLLGVAPSGKVTYPGASQDGALLEPHHTHFVLADSPEWGGETGLMIAVAETLADGASVVMVLAGGGVVARAEALEAARRQWPLFVIEGTGGAAVEIATAWRTHREPRRRPAAPTDLGLRRIVDDGDVRLFAGSEPGQLGRRPPRGAQRRAGPQERLAHLRDLRRARGTPAQDLRALPEVDPGPRHPGDLPRPVGQRDWRRRAALDRDRRADRAVGADRPGKSPGGRQALGGAARCGRVGQGRDLPVPDAHRRLCRRAA